MKGKSEVISVLNEMLQEELCAINQYMIHAEMCENWGYKKFGRYIKKQSIGEMKHAERLMERVLFLEGTPDVNNMPKVRVGKDVPQQIEYDLALEKNAVASYNRAIEICRKVSDNASADFLLVILKDEEGHVDFLETQLEVISKIGLENYLTQQIELGEG
ncbi:MAG TPA: bacterioferritin [Candidatus Acidoferrales bacterium]|nr:bacterioferritin [Candidatus Acidoferrales bacterium]